MNTVSTALMVLSAFASQEWARPRVERWLDTWQARYPNLPLRRRRKPIFTIGKGTTYFTKPVDKFGYIDYAAALHKRLSKGVTAANNANVLLWQATGPHPHGVTMPAEYFRWLKMREPPEHGDYFVDVFDFLRRQYKVDVDNDYDKLNTLLDRIQTRPWTARQYPRMAKWLTANEKPLAMVSKASTRPHFYAPLLPGTYRHERTALMHALRPGVLRWREMAFALVARAMLQTGKGRFDEAGVDLLACHRLGRLTTHGPTLVEYVNALYVRRLAMTAELAFLANAKLTLPQIKTRLKNLQSLPRSPSLADHFDLVDRVMFLDQLMVLDRFGLEWLESKKLLSRGRPRPLAGIIDWEFGLRNVNSHYDLLVDILRDQDYRVQTRKLERFDSELLRRRREIKKNLNLFSLLFMKSEERGETISDVLLAMHLTSMHNLQRTVFKIEQENRNLHVAYALAAYHCQHGRYPKSLRALVPNYLPSVPTDLFTGKALRYRRVGKGYLFYSIGANGQDEGGLSEDDIPIGDDLPVRMPFRNVKRT